MKNPHEGHRERLRNRYLTHGLEGFADHEVLELLLFQYLPYKDTNEIAHQLIATFGGLTQVLEASPEQLMRVKGIGKITAVNLSLLNEVFFRCKRNDAEQKPLENLQDILDYAKQVLSYSSHERFLAVYLDATGHVLRKRNYCSVDDASINVSIKSVLADALSSSAKAVMVFHGHVKGPVLVSKADEVFTKQLYFSLKGMGVELIEHTIFNQKGEVFSFRENKLIEKYKQSYLTKQ